MPLSELVNAPVDALQGVSAADAALLEKAFGIKTVGDMGRNKFHRVASAIVHLAQAR